MWQVSLSCKSIRIFDFFHSSHTFSSREPTMRHWDGSSSPLDSVCADHKTLPLPLRSDILFFLATGICDSHPCALSVLDVCRLARCRLFQKPNSKLMKIQSHQQISFVIIAQAIRTEMSAVSTGKLWCQTRLPDPFNETDSNHTFGKRTILWALHFRNHQSNPVLKGYNRWELVTCWIHAPNKPGHSSPE